MEFPIWIDLALLAFAVGVLWNARRLLRKCPSKEAFDDLAKRLKVVEELLVVSARAQRNLAHLVQLQESRLLTIDLFIKQFDKTY